MSDAKAVNIDDYVQLGNNTIVTEYQNVSRVNYQDHWFDLNVTLYINISNSWNNTINDIFVFDNPDKKKFGANVTGFNTTQHFKYVVESDKDIKKGLGYKYYVSRNLKTKFGSVSGNSEERHLIDFKDICGKEVANCSFNYVNNKKLEVDFYAEYNETLDLISIDPEITIDDVNSYGSIDNNITTNPNPMSHASINDSAVLLYMNFNVLNSSNTIYDWSSHGINGTIQTDYFINQTQDIQIGYGSSYDGDGNDDNSGGLDLGTPEATRFEQGFTLSIWVRRHSSGGGTAEALIAEGITQSSAEAESWNLVLFSDIPRFRLSDGTQFMTATAQAIPAEVWQHIVATFNGTNAKLYVNGSLESNAGPIEGFDINHPATRLETGIGGDFDGQRNYLSGLVDEVLIINRTLTDAEIQDLFNNQTSLFKQPATQSFQVIDIENNGTLNRLNVTTNTTQLFGTNISLRIYEWNGTHYNDSIDGDITSDEGIVGWWHFDNRSGFDSSTTAMGWSEYSNNGTYVGDAFSNSTGYYSGGLHLDGSGDYVDAESKGLSGISELTVSAWLRRLRTDGTNHEYIVALPHTADANGRFRVEGGSDMLELRINSNTHQGGTITDNDWHHTLATWNGSIVKIYLDGVQALETEETVASIDVSDVVIGAKQNGGTELNGTIDEVMIWNRSLSADEIEKLYIEGRLKYNPPSAWQNITDGDNQVTTFNILTTTDFSLLEFDFITDSNNFYSPILRDNIIVESFVGADAGNTVNACTTIDTAGVYTQNADITPSLSAGDACINISVSDVTYKGDGFFISDTTTDYDAIISVNTKNVTIQNVNLSTVLFTGTPSGVKFVNVNHSLIEDSFIYSTERAVDISGSVGINVTNNTLRDSFEFGIHLDESNDSLINRNSIINISDNTFGDGLRLQDSESNTIEDNVIWNTTTGILLTSVTKFNNFDNNSIYNADKHGIDMTLSGSGDFSDTVISNTLISLSKEEGLSIIDNTAVNDITGLNLTNLTITENNVSFPDIFIDDTNNDDNIEVNFIDDIIVSNYSFNVSSDVKRIDLILGEIDFLEFLNGTGNNLTNDMRIGNNSVVVEAGNNIGLNRSANVTLRGIGDRGFSNPVILVDGVNVCNATTSPTCFNFTSLTADNVIFNVSSWDGNYSIGSGTQVFSLNIFESFNFNSLISENSILFDDLFQLFNFDMDFSISSILKNAISESFSFSDIFKNVVFFSQDIFEKFSFIDNLQTQLIGSVSVFEDLFFDDFVSVSSVLAPVDISETFNFNDNFLMNSVLFSNVDQTFNFNVIFSPEKILSVSLTETFNFNDNFIAVSNIFQTFNSNFAFTVQEIASLLFNQNFNFDSTFASLFSLESINSVKITEVFNFGTEFSPLTTLNLVILQDFGFSDNFFPGITFISNVFESFSFSDSYQTSLAFTNDIFESFSFTDNFVISLINGANIQETFGISLDFTPESILSLNQFIDMTFSDNYVPSALFSILDNFSIEFSDKFITSSIFGVNLFEAFNIDIGFSDSASFIVKIFDVIKSTFNFITTGGSLVSEPSPAVEEEDGGLIRFRVKTLEVSFMNITTSDTWFKTLDNPVLVETFNITNDPVDIKEISFEILEESENLTIEQGKIERLDVGLYGTSFNIIETNLTSLTMRVKASAQIKDIEKDVSVDISDISRSDKLIKNIGNNVDSLLLKLKIVLRNYWIEILFILILISLALITAKLTLLDKKNKRV